MSKTRETQETLRRAQIRVVWSLSCALLMHAVPNSVRMLRVSTFRLALKLYSFQFELACSGDVNITIGFSVYCEEPLLILSVTRTFYFQPEDLPHQRWRILI